MSRWFRFYDDAMNDLKVQALAPDLFKAWVNLLCCASRNNGHIPDVDTASFALRVSRHKAAAIITKLAMQGLLDEVEGGYFQPHNWSKRQYISDGSSERVKRHRDKRAAAGLERQWFAPKELRNAVYERDDFKCIYCGSPDKLSLDHRTPEIRGGTHAIENLATACISCNGAKRDLTEQEFRERNVTETSRETLLKRPQSTEQNSEAKADSEPSLLTSPIEIINLSGEAKSEKRAPPRHGLTAKGLIYCTKGTPEWDSYADDYRQVRGEEPNANPDGGRWFIYLGEATALPKLAHGKG